MILEHLKISEESRNQAWDEKFFKLFSESNLKILSDMPQQGPDNWPYLMTEIVTETPSADDSIDSAQKILFWLSTRGIGLVVNPQRLPYPDFVFSYGMIWSFRETGYFMKYQKQDLSKELLIDNTAKAVYGEPTQEYFPQYARKVVREFLRDQSVFAPKVLMISTDSENYDLCFSLESFGSPKAEEHQGILEALAWFFPPHYSLALISEKNLPPFIPL